MEMATLAGKAGRKAGAHWHCTARAARRFSVRKRNGNSAGLRRTWWDGAALWHGLLVLECKTELRLLAWTRLRLGRVWASLLRYYVSVQDRSTSSTHPERPNSKSYFQLDAIPAKCIARKLHRNIAVREPSSPCTSLGDIASSENVCELACRRSLKIMVILL